jgi:hypothetical protein
LWWLFLKNFINASAFSIRMRVCHIPEDDEAFRAILASGHVDCRYLMAKVLRSKHHEDTAWIDRLPDSDIRKRRYQSIFCWPMPVFNRYVALEIEPEKVLAGNVNLVNEPYDPPDFYERSVMPLSTYLERWRTTRNATNLMNPLNSVNPFTALPMTEQEMGDFQREWGSRLGRRAPLAALRVFQYRLEIMVPRLSIPRSEFVEVHSPLGF